MSVRARNGRLVVDFYCRLPNNKKVRCVESTGLPDTKPNRKRLEKLDTVIKYEIKNGTFEYLKHFPGGTKAHLFKQQDSNMTFAKWWNQWLEEKTLRPNTLRNWQSAYRVHLNPTFGHLPLGEIDEPKILLFRKGLENKLKPNSINDKIMKPLCMCLLKAYKRGLISSYPCGDIKRLTEDKPDVDPLSLEELKHFLDFLKTKQPYWYPLFLLWSRTGLRPGEICALKWERVDYFNRKLMIRETRDSGVDGPPKTRNSIRDVDLLDSAIQALKMQEAISKLRSEYIFINENGRPLSKQYLGRKFAHLLSLCGLRLRPACQMRHTFVTLHLAAGENPSWVQRMIGHSTLKIMLGTYNRYIPNLKGTDGSAFEKAMEDSKNQLVSNGFLKDVTT